MIVDCEIWSAGHLMSLRVSTSASHEQNDSKQPHFEVSFGRTLTIGYFPPSKHTRGVATSSSSSMSALYSEPGILFMRAAVNPHFFPPLSPLRASAAACNQQPGTAVGCKHAAADAPVVADFACRVRPWAFYHASSFAPRRMDRVEWCDPEHDAQRQNPMAHRAIPVLTRRSVATGACAARCTRYSQLGWLLKGKSRR